MVMERQISMLCRTASVLLVLGLSVASCQSRAAVAESEPKLSILPPVAAVVVSPQIAPPGTRRKITVGGMWPTGCVPTGAALGEPMDPVHPAIGILLAEPLTFVACTTALTPYTFELEYTPRSAGQLEIVVMTNRASALARGTLVTGDAADPRSIHDVAGAWYDPQTAGSGVMIAHDYGQSDALFATWQVYDPATGASRWYSLQQGRWQDNGLVWLGRLYESKANPTQPCSLCPLPTEQIVDRGGVRLTFSANGASGGLDATLDFTDPSPPQRLSTLRRFLPNRIVIY